MSVSIYGILIFALLGFYILKTKISLVNIYKILFFVYLFVSFTFNIGSLFSIGKKGIGVDTFLSLVLLLLSVPFLLKKNYNKKIILYGMLFWISIFFGYIFFELFPYDNGLIQSIEGWDYFITGDVKLSYELKTPANLINLIIAAVRYPIILSIVYKNTTRNDWYKFCKKLSKFSFVIITYGILEYILKRFLGFNVTDKILLPIFGNTSAIANGVDRLQGFCKESSQYAFVLFLYSIIMIIVIKMEKSRNVISKIKLAFVYLLMLLSTSFSAVILLILSLIVWCIYLLESKKTKILIVSISLFIALIIVITDSGLISSFSVRMNRVINVINVILSGKEYHSYTTSEGARVSSIFYMIKILRFKPIFGVGIGITDAHSTFFAILGNFGVLGTLLLLKMIYKFSNAKDSKISIFICVLLASSVLMGGLGYFSAMYYPSILLMFSLTFGKKEVVYEKRNY